MDNVLVKRQVVRVLCQHRQGILLVKSQDRNTLWELPGGKVEIDEKPKVAARRELKEETNLVSSQMHFITAVRRPLPHDHTIVWDHFLYEAVGFDNYHVKIDGDEIIDFCYQSLAFINTEKLEDTSKKFLRSAIVQQYLRRS